MNLNLAVANTRDLTQHIRLIELVAADAGALPSYTAGAHLDFDLGDVGTRSYSLIDWALPAQSPMTYTLAVQREDNGDGGSKAMHNLHAGQAMHATEPKNNFELASVDAPSLLLAGGIGVTPMISMAATLQEQSRLFQFHYTGRSRSVMSFTEQMTSAFGAALHTYCDDESAINIESLFTNIDLATHVYICGPKGMIEAARTAAETAGIAHEQIHIELFSTPETSSADNAFEVEITSTGAVYTVPAGKSIIEVLEEEGIDLIYDCQRGDCGICQTEVVSGTPDHRDVVLSDAERSSGKVIQICVSRALSPRLVLDL